MSIFKFFLIYNLISTHKIIKIYEIILNIIIY
jgi:hypothetical protein